MIKLSNKARIKNAQEALKRADELARTTRSKFDNMTKTQILAELRKTRERLWNERLKKVSR